MYDINDRTRGGPDWNVNDATKEGSHDRGADEGQGGAVVPPAPRQRLAKLGHHAVG